MTVTQEEVDRLEKYVGLMQEVVDLKDDLAECLETLKELQAFKLPTHDQIQATARHLEELQAIEDLSEV